MSERELLAWAYSKLVYRSFESLEDCLAMDEIKLILMGAYDDRSSEDERLWPDGAGLV